MIKLEGASYGPHNDGKPGHLVILLHGYGADGNDLIGLAPVLAPLMPDVVFYAPNAPQPCEGNPFGYQWFPVSRLDPTLALAGVRSAAPVVDAFLDEKMAEHGLDESKTCLVGFSQGTMMALHVGLRRAKPLAGIIGFSGMLAGPEVLKDEIKSRPPVLLAHGDSDEMLPPCADRTRGGSAAAERRRRPASTSPRASATASTTRRCRTPRASCSRLSSCRCPNRTNDMTEGTCKPGFERVADAFEKNFARAARSAPRCA